MTFYNDLDVYGLKWAIILVGIIQAQIARFLELLEMAKKVFMEPSITRPRLREDIL